MHNISARGCDTISCSHLHRSKVAFQCYPLLVLASLGYPCLRVDDQLADRRMCPAVAAPGIHMQQYAIYAYSDKAITALQHNS